MENVFNQQHPSLLIKNDTHCASGEFRLTQAPEHPSQRHCPGCFADDCCHIMHHIYSPFVNPALITSGASPPHKTVYRKRDRPSTLAKVWLMKRNEAHLFEYAIL